MKKSVALFALLSLLVVTPSFGQGFLLKPLIGPFRAPDVEIQTLRTTPTVPQSINALVQDGGLPLTMNQMVRMTLENNFNLGINRFAPILSEYSIIQAYASFDPSLSLNGTVSRNKRATTSQTEGATVQSTLGGSYGATFSQNLKTGGSYSIRASVNRSSSNNALATYNPSWSGNMSYSFSQPLLRGFGVKLNTAPIVIAQNNLENSRIAFEQQVMDLVLQSTNTYWDLVYASETIRVRQNAVALAQQTLAENQRKIEIGTMAAVDLTQSQLDVANQQYQLLTAQNNRRQIEDNIKTMITRVPDPALFLVSLNPTDSIQNREATILPVEEAIQLAYRNRPDMRQFDLDMENNDLNLMTAKNNLLPNLNLSVSYNHNGQAGRQLIFEPGCRIGCVPIGTIDQGFTDLWGNLFNFDQAGYNIGFTLNIPIRNRNARAAYERQVISTRQLESRREVLMQNIALQVRNAYEQVMLARQQVTIAESSFQLAQIQLNSENRKFELGQSQLRFVIQEQNNLTSQEVALLNARINYVKALATYDNEIGRTLELNNVRIEDEYRPALASDTAPGVASRD